MEVVWQGRCGCERGWDIIGCKEILCALES